MKHPRLVDLEGKILAKLRAEGLTIQSPWIDIKECLSKTVAPDLCIKTAKNLKMTDNKPEQIGLFE